MTTTTVSAASAASIVHAAAASTSVAATVPQPPKNQRDSSTRRKRHSEATPKGFAATLMKELLDDEQLKTVFEAYRKNRDEGMLQAFSLIRLKAGQLENRLSAKLNREPLPPEEEEDEIEDLEVSLCEPKNNRSSREITWTIKPNNKAQ